MSLSNCYISPCHISIVRSTFCCVPCVSCTLPSPPFLPPIIPGGQQAASLSHPHRGLPYPSTIRGANLQLPCTEPLCGKGSLQITISLGLQGIINYSPQTLLHFFAVILNVFNFFSSSRYLFPFVFLTLITMTTKGGRPVRPRYDSHH